MINTEISTEVKAILDLLLKTQIGQTVTYTEISEAIGREIKAYRWVALRALDIAARDHGILFGNVKGAGYVRLSSDQLASVGHTARHHIARKAKKAQRNLSRASEAQNLSPTVALKVNAEISSLGLIREMSKDRYAEPPANAPEHPEPVAIVARRFVDKLKGA